MKVRIIGGSGSGKSTLAQALGERCGVPICDLDRLQWGGAYGQRRPEAERAALLREVLSQRDWIIEGVYYAWTAETFAQADAICLLEPAPGPLPPPGDPALLLAEMGWQRPWGDPSVPPGPAPVDGYLPDPEPPGHPGGPGPL